MSRRRLIAGVIAAVLLLAVVLTAIAPFLPGDDNPAASETTSVALSPLPDVTMSDLNGQAVRTGSLVGRPLVLNYWYSTCPPCEKELPAFAQVAAETHGEVRFVGVNPLDDADTARSFAAAHGVTYEQLLDHTGRSVDALGLTRFPSTVLVAADGRILEEIPHELSADELRSLIAEHFGT